jgi:hypothetical protein
MATRVYNASETKADLYNRITTDGEYELLASDTTLGDIPFSLWQYDVNSSAADNFAGGVIQPTLQTGNGRWLRRGYYNVYSSSTQSRSLNSAFQPSTTRPSNVSYSVSISVTSLLAGTNSGTVFLETSPDNSTWTTIAQCGLSIAGVAATQIASHCLSCYVPSGYYVRIRTAESGTNGADFDYLIGQETIL